MSLPRKIKARAPNDGAARRTKIAQLCLVVAMASCVWAMAAEAPKTPLSVARSLGEGKFKDWIYGAKASDKQVDCVQFVLAVVESLHGSAVDNATRTRILISDVKAADLQGLVDGGDAKIKGVATALVAAGNGTEVAPAAAKEGDFVQYWYKDGSDWAGHSGVISKLEGGMATIYGAHRSTLQREKNLPKADRKGGVGDGPVFRLTDTARKVFVVRWKA